MILFKFGQTRFHWIEIKMLQVFQSLFDVLTFSITINLVWFEEKGLNMVLQLILGINLT